jgi:hypothetical protein
MSTDDCYLEATRVLNRAGATEQELEKFLVMTANLLDRVDRHKSSAEAFYQQYSVLRDQSWFLAYGDCDFLLEAADAVDCGHGCEYFHQEYDTGAINCSNKEICGGLLAEDLRDMYHRVQRAKEKSKWYLRLLGLPTLLKSKLVNILTVRRKTS